ncbi:hypothetical protein BD410DRAFT_779445 [Rickenella mellea]|uniref:Uncharacterized protein n=1 Tax=Rickenella mellea TaxID=50990 RepID=A0A4R5XDI7_9AGAM|nr:hypothetical protein BD410DRAFT_779445 [Rickenella mellea]
MQRRIAPLVLHDGIRNIPPEILAHIFRIAHLGGGNQPHRITETLSLVCRRFRDSCLRTPEMWSSLRHDLSLDKTRLHLLRSKDNTINIIIHDSHLEEPTRLNAAKFLELVLPHTTRWGSLDINTEDSRLNWFLSNLPIVHLPRLARIRHVETDEMYQYDSQFFYSKWNMPSLRSLDGINVMPGRIFNGSNITECKLSWVPSWDTLRRQPRRIFLMNDLTSSLDSLQSLQILDLDFQQTDVAGAPAPVAFLSNLKSLTLRFGRYITSSDALYEVMVLFYPPALDTLHITIWNHQGARACKEIFTRHETPNIFRNLKTFSLRTDHYNDWNPFFSELLRQSPLLLHLVIQVSFTSFAQDIGVVNPEHLQTITFEKCDRLFEPHITAMYKNWRGRTMRRVEVIECKCLSESFLSKWEVTLKKDNVRLLWQV